MIRALYTATSGMLVESRKVDLSAKNLFYADTPGYKATRVLRSAQAATQPDRPTDVQTFRAGEFVDTTAGVLRPTGRTLDLALEGEGFFTVRTPGGPGYTRDGRFRVDLDRRVKDFTGNLLLVQRGSVQEPLEYPEELPMDAPVEVTQDGTVWVGDEEVGQLVLRNFPEYRGLQPASGALFFPTGAEAPQPSLAAVIQGHLENSNASSLAEMTRTLQTVRAFESYQKTIQTVMDEVTGEAVRRIGRVA